MRRFFMLTCIGLFLVTFVFPPSAWAAKERFDRSKTHLRITRTIPTAQIIREMVMPGDNVGISIAEARRAVDSFFDITTKVLVDDGRLIIEGFGVFFVFDDGKTRQVRFLSDEEFLGDIQDFWDETFRLMILDPDSDGDGLDFSKSDPDTMERNLEIVQDLFRARMDEYIGHVTVLKILFDNGPDIGSASRMNKAELIDAMASEANLSKADAKRALEALVNAITNALKNGYRVALIGFGTFSISQRAARTGWNPQTGAEIKIAAKNVIKFKAGADLSKKVN